MLDSTSGGEHGPRDAAVGAGMLFLISTAVATLFALQAPDASITGVVSDAETGAPVAGAAISLAESGLTSLSQADGAYVLSGVPEGPQAIAVARMHYYARTFRAIAPASGTLRIDIALHAAPTTLPAIEVRARAPTRGVDADDRSAGVYRRVSATAMRSDPRLAEPDALQALGGGEVALRPESPEGLHVLGGASDQVAYTLDGVPVFSPYHGAGTFSAWNPDALSHLDLIASPASPKAPDGLSGTVSAVTIASAPHIEMRGSVSTTQARTTLDGPAGWADAGYLISLRSTFPGLLAHRREGSYLEGESSDWLLKLESPLGGGRLRLLGYGSDNEISAARSLLPPSAVGEAARNRFLWAGQSFGADWSRQVAGASVRLGLWSAAMEAGATWLGTSVDRLESRRRDLGVHASVDAGVPGRHTSFTIHVRRSATFYRLLREESAQPDALFDLTTPLLAAGLAHERALSTHTVLVLSLGTETAEHALRVDPGAELQWRPTESLSLSAGYSRRHQFAQSLRNEESVVGSIFPADLYVGSGGSGVPIARSDLGAVTLDYRPGARTRLTGRAYLRDLGGLVLVSPRSDGPFAGAAGFPVGSGTAAGIAVEAATAGPGYGLLVNYGLQRTRLTYEDTTYVPAFGVTHSLEAGALLLPSASTSLRVGFTALFGRHGTTVTGPFEWEGCNLLDRGCEFAGSPRQATQGLGLLALPAYFRIDLGVRQRWRLRIGNRDAELAFFGTLTNVLDRQNVLTEVADPATGALGPVDMRPRSPLTVGLDWRY